jgi:sporulation protein YtfJ
MVTAMNSIRGMIDVNTIVGDPIETSVGTIIIPVSKVVLGFAAGGSEFNGETLDEYSKKEKEEQIQYRLPFGGGSGAGININPIAFLIVQKDTVKLLAIDHISTVDKLLDYAPEIIEKLENIICTKK